MRKFWQRHANRDSAKSTRIFGRGIFASGAPERKFASNSAKLRVETLESRLMMTGVVINEILASSSGQYIQDEDGDDSDYIELYNSSANTVDLSGWYLTDNDSQLTKWQIPSVELAPGEYLVIFASSKNRIDPLGELHTNFALSAEGEYLALVQADGTTVESALTPQFPEQYSDASYGLADIYVNDVFVGQELRYFDPPTPGAENGEGLLGIVEGVSVSQSHGFFEDAFMLNLSTPTAGAQIYYTVDGSVPSPGNASAVLYTGSIEITRSTIIRAAAHKDDYGMSPVATQTYIFLEDILTQTIDRTNPANNPFGLGYAATWQGVAGDYNMDPSIVADWDDNNPANDDFGIREALLALPTMSVVMDHDDLWDPATGIYTNAHMEGEGWRKPGSIEYFDPAGGAGFQYNVGVQIHGRGSRSADQPKHSFRLIFNPEFDGPGRLNFPLFDQSEFADINTVVLKGMNQDNFAVKAVTDRFSSLTATNMKDQWMQDTFRAMGNTSAQHSYAHLYVNGLYWGLYQAVERMDDASVSSHLGGESEDWDIIRPDNEYTGSTEAWDAMFALARSIPSNATTANAIYYQLQGMNPDGTRNESLPVYLDMDNLIDYLLVHYYAGANEWTGQFVAARNREEPGSGFKFFVWDQDVTFGYYFGGRIETPATGTSSAQELKFRLQKSPEFRLRFADRAQMHLFNGGALSNEQALSRWDTLAAKIEPSIVADSARWGDSKAGKTARLVSGQSTIVLPEITIDHWRDAVEHVKDFSQDSHAVILDYLKYWGALFPDLSAPQINQFGGAVASGFAMTLAKVPGTSNTAKIYYTLDGSDPRSPGGVLSPGAIEYTGPVTLLNDAQVRARVLHNATWSPLINPDFSVLAPRIPGDFDDSGEVEYDDAALWHEDFGSTVTPGTRSDADRDGAVTAADYVVWKKFNLPGPDTDYNFNSIGQTYTQDFDDFRGSAETLPEFFSMTFDAGTNVYRGVFDSTTDTASSFTGIKAATSDDINHSLAWRESTGSANLEDARFLFKIQNSTGEAITGFQVSYDVEAWVNGVRDNQVRFKYDVYADSDESQAAEGRQAFESDIFATPNPHHTVTASAFVLNGKAAANRVTVSGYVDLTTLLISDADPGLGSYGALAPGETAYFRWQISNYLIENGNRSALGIDNFTITALTGAPGGGGMAFAGLTSNENSDAMLETASENLSSPVKSGAVFDAAIESWNLPTSAIVAVGRGVLGTRVPVAMLPPEDALLLASQPRIAAKRVSADGEFDLGFEEAEGWQDSNERDDLFAEVGSCSAFDLFE